MISLVFVGKIIILLFIAIDGHVFDRVNLKRKEVKHEHYENGGTRPLYLQTLT